MSQKRKARPSDFAGLVFEIPVLQSLTQGDKFTLREYNEFRKQFKVRMGVSFEEAGMFVVRVTEEKKSLHIRVKRRDDNVLTFSTYLGKYKPERPA